MNPLTQVKNQTPLFLVVTFICFGLLLELHAVSPPPDGGYPGGNTAEGQAALLSLTTGGFNTAVGFLSLRSNTSASFNTAIGAGALLATTGGSKGAGNENTATGAGALLSNVAGFSNTANGAFALSSNTIGNANTANGDHALSSNTASSNTANGAFALEDNTTGSGNTAMGYTALIRNTTSNFNTAVGEGALFYNTGTGNTAVGYSSLQNLSSGDYNVAVAGGFNLIGGDFNIDIGNDGVNGDSGVIRIGSGCCQNSAFIAGIWGVTANGGAAVYVNSDGQVGTTTSSRRFKEDIKPMGKTSELLFSLKPVSFHYKKEIDPAGTSQWGLVAEDVEKINPGLIVRDKEGKPYSVRYDQVNAMLLNEFLKEHKTVREQGATIARLQNQIEALTAGLQKVNAQLELSKSAPQTVLNSQ